MKTYEDPKSKNNTHVVKCLYLVFYVDNYQICHDLINVYNL